MAAASVLLCILANNMGSGPAPRSGEPVNVAPFAIPLPDGAGLVWEDPREIHRVVVRFAGPVPPPNGLHLEYWGSRWPEQRLPKDREPGGGDVGWWELGNWYNGGWRRADVVAEAEGQSVTFTFRPANRTEFPRLTDFPATYRYTLKLRLTSDEPLPPIDGWEAYTDSTWEQRAVRICWKNAPRASVTAEAFNGYVTAVQKPSASSRRLVFWAASNRDPNTFDRTLVTVRRGRDAFTFSVADLSKGPIYLPHLGVAVLADQDARSYAQVQADAQRHQGASLYDRVAAMPEQTWTAAWEGMPPKKSLIHIPLGADGGRQRFRLDANGGFTFRTNDRLLVACPGRETSRLAFEKPEVRFDFGLPDGPASRTIADGCIPMVDTAWERDGLRIAQTAFVTPLEGTQPDGGVPPSDAFAVLMARFTVTNPSAEVSKRVTIPISYRDGDGAHPLHLDADGFLWAGDRLRGMLQAEGSTAPKWDDGQIVWQLAPGQQASMVLKIPYVVLTQESERSALRLLDFSREAEAVRAYWRHRLDEGMRLITPEPMLNEFHRAHAGHLLINCEREPGATNRFARVGSFYYAAYGNESCMMVVDLDRRGYHKEAEECLESWLKYQGTVGLPGDFSAKDGVLYGAHGYEDGGYNQHHGWILWCLVEHYRFTRNRDWLRHASPGILAAADWIVQQRARTAGRTDLGRGLLPAGSLEDIGDWWPWLSTNCYTWRGLDAAAWALDQIGHPQATRLRKEADDYRQAILRAFRAAAARSPVVALRDGTWVPHFPSHPYRRGRSFGWICETLEGALHLLITRALDPKSQEAVWILKDYEDNLYLSNQYGYTLDEFDKYWFGRGGMSMQACLLLDAEPYLYRDDVKQALRAIFNAIAVGYFPDARMLTEHALPEMGDWRGDHYKTSDEANAAGWLRYLFVREEGDNLLVGQAIPRTWLTGGKTCGVERASTYFGPMSVVYSGGRNTITARLEGPRRNPPRTIRLRFREPSGRPLERVTVNGEPWSRIEGEWVILPGDIGKAEVVASWR